MAHETAAEDRAARHAPSIVMRSDPLDRLERLAQFLADPLVGVEGQHPVARGAGKSKVLLRTEAVPGLNIYVRRKLAGNIHRSVRAPRIGDDDFIRPGDRIETTRNVRFLVLGDDDDRDGHGQRLLKFSVYRVSASTLSRISNDHAQARSRLLRQLMSRACVRRKVISTWWLPWAGSAGFPGAGKSVSELGDDIVFAKLAALRT